MSSIPFQVPQQPLLGVHFGLVYPQTAVTEAVGWPGKTDWIFAVTVTSNGVFRLTHATQEASGPTDQSSVTFHSKGQLLPPGKDQRQEFGLLFQSFLAGLTRVYPNMPTLITSNNYSSDIPLTTPLWFSSPLRNLDFMINKNLKRPFATWQRAYNLMLKTLNDPKRKTTFFSEVVRSSSQILWCFSITWFKCGSDKYDCLYK